MQFFIIIIAIISKNRLVLLSAFLNSSKHFPLILTQLPSRVIIILLKRYPNGVAGSRGNKRDERVINRFLEILKLHYLQQNVFFPLHCHSMANFPLQSDAIYFFIHHISRSVNMKCKYGNKYLYLSPIVLFSFHFHVNGD